jgi:hypothetical protein
LIFDIILKNIEIVMDGKIQNNYGDFWKQDSSCFCFFYQICFRIFYNILVKMLKIISGIRKLSFRFFISTLHIHYGDLEVLDLRAYVH